MPLVCTYCNDVVSPKKAIEHERSCRMAHAFDVLAKMKIDERVELFAFYCGLCGISNTNPLIPGGHDCEKALAIVHPKEPV